MPKLKTYPNDNQITGNERIPLTDSNLSTKNVPIDTLGAYIQANLGLEGPPGPAGGAEIFTQAGVPASGLGDDGDIYIDTDTGNLYKKETGAWVLQASLVGPAGPEGPEGPVGPEGPAGAGTGDMLISVYDPTSVSGDAFDMDNMVEGATTKIMTNAERTKLAGIEAGATADQSGAEIEAALDAQLGTSWKLSGGSVDSVNGNIGVVVLDADDIDDSATTNKFATAAELSKLAGIEANAKDDQNAAQVPITDTAGHYTSGNVEGALDEIGDTFPLIGGDWTFVQVGLNLEFRYNGTTVLRLSSAGTLEAAGNIGAGISL